MRQMPANLLGGRTVRQSQEQIRRPEKQQLQTGGQQMIILNNLHINHAIRTIFRPLGLF
jgi:hypothetical protein